MKRKFIPLGPAIGADEPLNAPRAGLDDPALDRKWKRELTGQQVLDYKERASEK